MIPWPPSCEAAGNVADCPHRRVHTDIAMAWIIPGDPARIALGPTHLPKRSPICGLPCISTIISSSGDGHFVADVARGDLGVSLYTNRPVTADIALYLPATLELVLVAGLMMVGIGLPLGIWSARCAAGGGQHDPAGLAARVSAPSFVWAVILMLLFAFYLPLFPIAGRISDSYAISSVTGFLLIDTLLQGDAALGNAAGTSCCRHSRWPCRVSDRRRG